jgi:alpha-beta hydrolase superfamily lysophospholipase
VNEHIDDGPGYHPASTSEDVSFEAADGTTLKGTVYQPYEVKAGVVCLPMYGRTRETFNPIVDLLVQQGLVVLTLDPRGVGDSGSDADRKAVKGRETAVFKAQTQDVEAAYKLLHDKYGLGADAPTGLIGASIGAAVSVLYAADHPGLKALVLLSPGDYMGTRASSVAGRIKARVLLTTEDEGTAAPIRQALEAGGNAPEYYAHAVGDKDKPIKDHATNQFGKDYGVEDKLVEFLHSALGV